MDKGKLALANAPGDEITRGLDGLEERLAGYQQQGARFAKWRDVYHISSKTPSRLAIRTNAEVLARYAAICQVQGIVPIVEPEVLIDGTHSIERSAEVNEAVLHAVFHALHRHHVSLEHMLLKPSMVIAGIDHPQSSTPEDIAAHTLRIFRRTVPANLNALNTMSPQPWELSFSYGRALQEPALLAWKGDAADSAHTQAALYKRAKLNGAARCGVYSDEMESVDA